MCRWFRQSFEFTVGGQKTVKQHMEARSVKRWSNSPPNTSVLNKYWGGWKVLNLIVVSCGIFVTFYPKYLLGNFFNDS